MFSSIHQQMRYPNLGLQSSHICFHISPTQLTQFRHIVDSLRHIAGLKKGKGHCVQVLAAGHWLDLSISSRGKTASTLDHQMLNTNVDLLIKTNSFFRKLFTIATTTVLCISVAKEDVIPGLHFRSTSRYQHLPEIASKCTKHFRGRYTWSLLQNCFDHSGSRCNVFEHLNNMHNFSFLFHL